MLRTACHILALSLLALPLRVDAQDAATSLNPRLSFTLGVSSTTLSTAGAAGAADRQSALPGVELALPLTARVAFVPSLLLVRKGARFTTPRGDRQALDWNYVELPLLLRVELPTQLHVTPFLSGGPALALQTGCWIDDSVQPRATCHAYDRTPASGGIPDRRRFDVSALVGGGLTIPAAGHRVRIGALYDRGLRRVNPPVATRNRAWYYLTSLEW